MTYCDFESMKNLTCCKKIIVELTSMDVKEMFKGLLTYTYNQELS